MDKAAKETEIKKLYYDPETGLGSVHRFWQRFKGKFKELGIRKKQVIDVLQRQEVRQLMRKRRRKDWYTILSPAIKNNYQMDLLDIHQNQRWNRGYRWMMVCIDVYSRYMMVVPMKRKTVGEVLRAYKEITRKMGIPKNLNTDLESAVMGGKFQALLKQQGTSHWANDPEAKRNNSIVERVNRTLREYLRAYFKAYKTKNWIDVIARIVKRYNSDRHRMIRAKPIDIWNNRAKPNQTINRPVFDIDIGDQVRYLKAYPQFTKISNQKVWSKNVYTVIGKEGKRFKLLKNSDNTTVLWKVPNDLQKVRGAVERFVPPADVPEVPKEEVVSERALRRKRRVLAKEGISEEAIIEGPRLRKRKAKPPAAPKPKRKTRAKPKPKPVVKAERGKITKFTGFKKVGASYYYEVKRPGVPSKYEPMKDLKTTKYGVGLAEFVRLEKLFAQEHPGYKTKGVAKPISKSFTKQEEEKAKPKPPAAPKPKRKTKAKAVRGKITKFTGFKKVGSSYYYEVSPGKYEPMKDLKTTKYGVGLAEFVRLEKLFAQEHPGYKTKGVAKPISKSFTKQEEEKAKPKPPKKKKKKGSKQRYEIEKFVGQQKIGSSLYFMVKWKGQSSSHNSLEPMKDLKSKKYGVGAKEFARLRTEFNTSVHASYQ